MSDRVLAHPVAHRRALVVAVLAVLLGHALLLQAPWPDAPWLHLPPPSAPAVIDAVLIAPAREVPAPVAAPAIAPAVAHPKPAPPPPPHPPMVPSQAMPSAVPAAPSPQPAPEPEATDTQARAEDAAPVQAAATEEVSDTDIDTDAAADAAPFDTSDSDNNTDSDNASAPLDLPTSSDAHPTLPAPTAAGPAMLQVRTASGQAHWWSLAAPDSALPAQAQLHYKVHGWVKGHEYHAQAALTWQQHQGRYTVQQTISAFLLGSMAQTSRGVLGPQGLQPTQFDDRRWRKRRSATLDWPAGQAQFQPPRAAVAIGPGTQDRLSVFFQLAALLQAEPVLRAPGTEVRIPTLGTRQVQLWRFQVETEDTWDGPHGPVPTLRLRRQLRPGDQAQATLWLAPALHYLPVRLALHDDEEQLTLTLERHTLAP